MIGGEHFLAAPKPVEDSLGELLERELGCIAFFATGRDALATLLASLPETSVRLPDLMCASVHAACRAAGKSLEFYPVGTDFLHTPGVDMDWEGPGITFVMHYFGIRNDALMRRAKAAGHTVVSDVSHLLFDCKGLGEVACHSDFLIASLRKSGPFPDGGFISSLTRRPVEPGRGLREEFFASRAAGLLSRGFSAACGFVDDENFYLLKGAEESLDGSEPGDFGCSQLSRQLTRSIPVASTAAAIRRNIEVLDALHTRCIVPLDDTLITPYVPCLFDSRETRDKVRSALAARHCFFPVHWPAAGLPVESPLSTLSLNIPCDARYDEHAMRFVVEIIESCLPR